MDSPFWGIISRKASLPLGQITLLVQFSTAKHFRVDYVNFPVADFNTAYHAILDQPTLAKFMVVPHYTYLVLKMPMEQGSSPYAPTLTSPTPVKRKASRSPKLLTCPSACKTTLRPHSRFPQKT